MLDFLAHPLVEPSWLAAHLADGDLRVVDARWRGDGTGQDLYRQGHLPGAVHLDWQRDLSWTDGRGAFTGRFFHAATLEARRDVRHRCFCP